MKLRQPYKIRHIQFEMLSVMAVFQIILCLIVYHCLALLCRHHIWMEGLSHINRLAVIYEYTGHHAMDGRYVMP